MQNREHCRRTGFAGLLLALLLGLSGQHSPAQRTDANTPTQRIEEECVALSWAPDSVRLAFAVRRVVRQQRLEMQRDDIWLLSLAEGKRRRIVNGEKIVSTRIPFSYTVRGLRWSPDGHRLTAELDTRQMVDERGNTREEWMTLLLDENGREIKIQGGDSVIPQALGAAWLGDGVTVGYLTEVVSPRLLFSLHTVRPVAGRGRQLFSQSTFAAVAWIARQNLAVAIERDVELRERPRLVRLDLERQTRQVLAELEGFFGHLTVSPSGEKVAYFRDADTLEIRRLDGPMETTRLRMAYGRYQWAPDESRLLLHRAVENRSGSLHWVRLPGGEVEPVLHGLSFRDAELSPDGRWLAVLQPGSQHLLVYALQ
ncbi:MAG: hypothetical protein K6U09_01980 [Acidobacteriia bacterium]|jgi:Tol biopolymer transport system component|nr:hypothetical protein [Terriglobia bacterium]